MRKATALILLMTFITSTAFAQEAPKLTPIPPGEDKITVVREKDPVPYTGQLFDNPTALRWGNYLQQCQYRLKADPELAKKLAQADTDYYKKLYEIEHSRYLLVTADYQKQLADTRSQVLDPPFYKTTWFGIVVGVVGTVAAVSATAYLVHN